MLLLALFPPPASPKADFARCVSVMRRSTTYAVTVHATTVGHATAVSTSATLAVRSKEWISLDVSTPAEGNHGALNWVCEVHGRTLQAYDTNRRAYIRQTFARPLPAAAGLSAQFGTMIPDPVNRLMNPVQLTQFFARFAGLKGWHRAVLGDVVAWKYRNPVGTVAFNFSRRSGRLTRWQIGGVNTTTWELKYLALSAVPPLSIPADAVRVETFRLPPARPKIADPSTHDTVDRCFHAYEKAFRFRAVVRVDGAKYDLWRDGGTVEEIGPLGGWRWSRGDLTLWPKSGGVFHGRTNLGRVRSFLVQLQIDAEPLALAVLNDDNYAGTLLTSDYAVKKVGSVTLAGEPLSLLQVAGPAVKFDLTIDSKGLIRRIDSTAYDSNGRRMTETVRDITYSALGVPAAPPGGRRAPLPRLKPLPKPPPLPRRKK
ncbi:MAG: hypothetical protein ACYC96_05910 [Fimbriimonadaceae bacterium]